VKQKVILAASIIGVILFCAYLIALRKPGFKESSIAKKYTSDSLYLHISNYPIGLSRHGLHYNIYTNISDGPIVGQVLFYDSTIYDVTGPRRDDLFLPLITFKKKYPQRWEQLLFFYKMPNGNYEFLPKTIKNAVIIKYQFDISYETGIKSGSKIYEKK